MEYLPIHWDLTEFLLLKSTNNLHLVRHHVYYVYDVTTFFVDADC